MISTKGFKNTLVTFALAVVSFSSSAGSCKPEGAALSVSEEYLWLLKSRSDVSENQYKEAYNIHAKFEKEYQTCIKAAPTHDQKD